jgi:tRNA nucleotidyltransferase (CCA-adding enzyme)
MQRLDELGVLVQLHPQLTWTQQAADYFALLPALQNNPVWQEVLAGSAAVVVYFLLWIADQPDAVQQEVVSRLHGRKSTRVALEQLARLRRDVASLTAKSLPSQVEKTLRPYANVPVVLATLRIMQAGTLLADQLNTYQERWRHVQTAMTGNDLRAAGLKPGPHFALILDQLRAARLDGLVNTLVDEQALLAEIVAQQEEAPS